LRNTIIQILAFLLLAGSTSVWAQKDNHLPIDLTASLDGGYYDSGVLVELVATQGADIYYTLDGARPGRNSNRYRGPIPILRTTSLRAVAFLGNQKSSMIGHTYLIREPPTRLPTVCISLPSYVLFDPVRGLFVEGPNTDSSILRKPGANFWSRREMFIHAEIMDEAGRQVHNSPMGMRLFGGMSRLFPQKSLTLVARDRYGQKMVRYPVFGQDGLNKFKYLVLRNSGSDWGKSHLRDAFMISLLEGWDMEKQDYQPAHVYINGKYWGLYNLREKINKFFIEDHADVDKDSIDYIEHHMTLKAGSRYHYQRLRRFIHEKDIRLPANYAWVAEQMEIDNFIDLQVAQIFFDNRDAGGNIRFWRPQTPDGKWRWIIYDTDQGFGLHRSRAYAHNTLHFHTQPDGPDWPNPPWSTFLLRRLLENPTFRDRFINRFADHLNTSFREERAINKLDEMSSRIRPEIGRHFERWGLSADIWEGHLLRMKRFALERPNMIRHFLAQRFDLGDATQITVLSGKGGSVLVNDHVRVNTGRFQGTYFSNIPIQLEAKPSFGYRFSHWEHLGKKASPDKIVIDMASGPRLIRAVFERYEHPLAGKVIINEIGPNNPDRKGGDWLEIFNSTRETVSLKNWILSDEKHDFILPDVRIPANDYLVICEDSLAFRKHFPQAFRVLGGLPYGINKRKESLILFNEEATGIDSLSYRVYPTDSTFTLSLLLPFLDNADLENWNQRVGNGTPGQANPYYLESRIFGRQQAWLRVGVAIVTLLFCSLLLYLRAKGRL